MRSGISQRMLRLRVVYDDRIVYFYGDPFALYFDVFGEPFIILDVELFYVYYIVQAACANVVGMGIVHLYFVSPVGPTALLIGGMEINAGIGMGEGLNIRFKFEILEIVLEHVAVVEEMGSVPMHDDTAAVCVKSR